MLLLQITLINLNKISNYTWICLIWKTNSKILILIKIKLEYLKYIIINIKYHNTKLSGLMIKNKKKKTNKGDFLLKFKNFFLSKIFFYNKNNFNKKNEIKKIINWNIL